MGQVEFNGAPDDLTRSIAAVFREWNKSEGVVADLALTHTDLETEELYARLRGEDWATLPREVIAGPCPPSCLMSDGAFTYFLPAFLLEALHEDCGWEFRLHLVNRI